MKKAVMLTLALLITLLLCGCNQSNEKPSLLEYINTKYDDRFTYAAPFGGQLGDTSSQIIVQSKEYPDQEVWVGYGEVNGEFVYRDNYMDIVHEEETRNRLTQITSEVFNSDVEVKYEAYYPTWGSRCDEDATFDEYFSTNEDQYIFSARVAPSEGTWRETELVQHFVDISTAYNFNFAATFFLYTTQYDYDLSSPTEAVGDVYRMFLVIGDGEVVSQSLSLVQKTNNATAER